MDTYKLTYFNLKGIAEPIRILFNYVKVPFEDNLIDCKVWYDINKDFKWQQLPYLEYNGKTLTQTQAIGTFLCQKFQLESEDSWDRARCDEIYGAITDLRIMIKPFVQAKHAEGDTDNVKQLKEKLLDSTIPLFLTNLNELLEEIRKSKDGMNAKTDLILGGDKPTWADFCLASFTDSWSTALDLPDLLDKYPLLKKQQTALFSLPGVAEYISTRPLSFV